MPNELFLHATLNPTEQETMDSIITSFNAELTAEWSESEIKHPRQKTLEIVALLIYQIAQKNSETPLSSEALMECMKKALIITQQSRIFLTAAKTTVINLLVTAQYEYMNTHRLLGKKGIQNYKKWALTMLTLNRLENLDKLRAEMKDYAIFVANDMIDLPNLLKDHYDAIIARDKEYSDYSTLKAYMLYALENVLSHWKQKNTTATSEEIKTFLEPFIQDQCGCIETHYPDNLDDYIKTISENSILAAEFFTIFANQYDYFQSHLTPKSLVQYITMSLAVPARYLSFDAKRFILKKHYDSIKDKTYENISKEMFSIIQKISAFPNKYYQFSVSEKEKLISDQYEVLAQLFDGDKVNAYYITLDERINFILDPVERYFRLTEKNSADTIKQYLKMKEDYKNSDTMTQLYLYKLKVKIFKLIDTQVQPNSEYANGIKALYYIANEVSATRVSTIAKEIISRVPAMNRAHELYPFTEKLDKLHCLFSQLQHDWTNQTDTINELFESMKAHYEDIAANSPDILWLYRIGALSKLHQYLEHQNQSKQLLNPTIIQAIASHSTGMRFIADCFYLTTKDNYEKYGCYSSPTFRNECNLKSFEQLSYNEMLKRILVHYPKKEDSLAMELVRSRRTRARFGTGLYCEVQGLSFTPDPLNPQILLEITQEKSGRASIGQLMGSWGALKNSSDTLETRKTTNERFATILLAKGAEEVSSAKIEMKVFSTAGLKK